MTDLNRGFNIDAYGGFKNKVEQDNDAGIREKVAVSEWIQGEESRVTIGGKELTIGSDDGMNMMEVLLASLAACDTAVVGLHASYMGLKVNSIRVEVSGEYNVASYIGVDGAPGSGFNDLSMKIHLDAPDATPEQLGHLAHILETGSPVGDTFHRPIPVDVEIIANQA